MGYCWTSGKKVRGRWKFLKCNGNKNRNKNCYPESPKEFPRCRDCVEWCKTYSDAVTVVKDYEKGMEKNNSNIMRRK